MWEVMSSSIGGIVVNSVVLTKSGHKNRPYCSSHESSPHESSSRKFQRRTLSLMINDIGLKASSLVATTNSRVLMVKTGLIIHL
jgi:hypothetical protein